MGGGGKTRSVVDNQLAGDAGEGWMYLTVCRLFDSAHSTIFCMIIAARSEAAWRIPSCMKENNSSVLSNVLDLLLDAICIVDLEGQFIYVSAAGERIFGYKPEEMIGKPMIDFVYQEDRSKTIEAANRVVGGHLQLHFENRYLRKDGQLVHIMWSARWSDADQVRVAVARDVTERKRAEATQKALHSISEAAHFAEDLFALFQRIHLIIASLLRAENFVVALYDREKDALAFPYHIDNNIPVPEPNRKDTAYLSAEIVRTGSALLLKPGCRWFPEDIAAADTLDTSCWLGVPLSTKAGIIGALVVHDNLSQAQYTESDQELLQFVSAQIATTIERKQMEVQLQYMARHDSLTDLPNRDLFHERLRTALAQAQRDQTSLSLLYLDLDNFKQINDALGHSVGDLLLQEVAVRLKASVRETDTVGRVGGDEFLVLLTSIRPECTMMLAEKIRLALSQAFDIAGQMLEISPSIGVALYPEHGDDYKHLILIADQAMYSAKRIGGNCARLGSDNDGVPSGATLPATVRAKS